MVFKQRVLWQPQGANHPMLLPLAFIIDIFFFCILYSADILQPPILLQSSSTGQVSCLVPPENVVAILSLVV